MYSIAYLVDLRGRIRRSFIHRGIGGTMLYVPRYCIDMLRRMGAAYKEEEAAELRTQETFDRSFNVSTAGTALLTNMDVTGPNRELGHYYLGTVPKTFNSVMRDLPVTHQDFIFIDYGSGKGKALFLAALWPFRKIIGVEFARPLHEAAIRNCDTFSHPGRQCHDIEPLHMDAGQYDLPLTPLILYFYNPFSEALMATVLQKIEDSLRLAPRDIWICYCYLYADGPLKLAQFLELITATTHYKIYRAAPKWRE